MGKKQKAINAIKKAVKTAKKVEKIAQFTAKIAAAPGRTGGAYIGKKLAGPAGERIGSSVGHYLGRLVGAGAYTLNGNSLARAGGTLAIAPTFSKHPDGIRVQFTEYIGDLFASPVANSFQNQSFAVNPGQYTIFPWLSASFGNVFDLWQPNGIVIIFKSLSSTFNGENASLGEIIMASDYDVLDQQYTSKIEMLNTDFACSADVTKDMIHPIECAVKQRPTTNLYTRSTTAFPAKADPKMYDLCNFQVATSGCLANQLVGELWISYDITFRRKQVFSLIGTNIFNTSWIMTDFGTTHFFGDTYSMNLGDNASTMNAVNAGGLTAASQLIGADSSIDLVLYPDGLIFNKRFVSATFLLRFLGTCSTSFTMSLPGFPSGYGVSPGEALSTPVALTTGVYSFSYSVILTIIDPGSKPFCLQTFNPWTAMGTVEQGICYIDQVQPNYLIQM